MRKVAPLPGWLSAHSRPPLCRTIPYAAANPRPRLRPFALVLKKGSYRCAQLWSSKPGSAVAHCQHSVRTDRKSTRLNSSHRCISYAVFCLKKQVTTVEQRALHLLLELIEGVSQFDAHRLGRFRQMGPHVCRSRARLFFLNEQGPPKIHPFPPPIQFPL